jgi:hypothetical protein
MTQKFNIPAIFIIYCVLPSCRKQITSIQPLPNSSITLVNAVIGSNPLITTFTPDSTVASFYFATAQVGFQSWNEYSQQSGNSSMIIYQESDTNHVLFSGNFNFRPYSIYSLFLSGQLLAQNAPDTLLVEDFPPYHSAADSVIGVRFVNLSPGIPAISVDIAGGSPGSEVGSLNYKGITNFKDYILTSTTPDPSMGYTFEFRLASTDSLLATFSFSLGSIPEFKNVTIVFSGSIDPNAGSPLGTFMVNNY